MKDSVTKFDLEAAFKALDSFDYEKPVKQDKQTLKESRQVMKMHRSMDALFEDFYDIEDENDINDLADEREAEVAQAKLARIEKIVDLDAKTADELLPSYVGKVIIQCPQCMNLFYKNEEDIEKDEEDPTTCNVNEPCQHCGNISGYSIIGKVDAVSDDEMSEFTGDVSDDENEELNLDFDATEEENTDDDLDLDLGSDMEGEESEEDDSEETDEDLDLDLDLDLDDEEEKNESLNNSKALKDASKNTDLDTKHHSDNLTLNEGVDTELAEGYGEGTYIIYITDANGTNTEEKVDCSLADIKKKIEAAKNAGAEEVFVSKIENGKETPLDKLTYLKHELEVDESLNEAKADYKADYRFYVIYPGIDKEPKIFDRKQITSAEMKQIAKEEAEAEGVMQVSIDRIGKNGKLTELPNETIDNTENTNESLSEDIKSKKNILQAGDTVYDTYSRRKCKIPKGCVAVYTNNTNLGLTDLNGNPVAVIDDIDLREFIKCDKMATAIYTELEHRGGDKLVGLISDEITPEIIDKYNLTDVLGYDLSEADLNGAYILYDIIECDASDYVSDDFEDADTNESVNKAEMDKNTIPEQASENESINEAVAITISVDEVEDEVVANGPADAMVVDVTPIGAEMITAAECPECEFGDEPTEFAPKFIPEESAFDAPIPEVVDDEDDFEEEDTEEVVADEITVDDEATAEEETPVEEEEIDAEDDIEEEEEDEDEVEESLNKSETAPSKNASENTSDNQSLNEAADDVSDAEYKALLNSKEFKTPISDAEVQEILGDEQVENLDINELEECDENALEECLRESLMKVYENVKTFNVIDCAIRNNNFIVEGLITFVSGTTRETNYVFNEAYSANNQFKLVGTNKMLADDGKFVLEGKLVNKNNLIAESLSYKYHVGTELVEGLIKR